MTWSFGDELRKAMGLKCTEKVRYATLAEAQEIAQKRTAPGAKNRARFLQAYPCDKGCLGFHLTARPFRDKIKDYPVIGDWTEAST